VTQPLGRLGQGKAELANAAEDFLVLHRNADYAARP
jgi:hypothetical protein